MKRCTHLISVSLLFPVHLLNEQFLIGPARSVLRLVAFQRSVMRRNIWQCSLDYSGFFFFFYIFNAFLDSVSYLSVYNSLWATMSSLCCKNWETWGYQRWSERTQEWRKREQNHREMQMLRRRRWLLVTSQSIRVTVPLKITQHQLFCSILHSRDRRWCYTPKKVSQIRVEVTHPCVPTP